MAMTLEKTIYTLHLELYKITCIKCNWPLHLDSHAGISKHLCVYTASTPTAEHTIKSLPALTQPSFIPAGAQQQHQKGRIPEARGSGSRN